METLTSRLAGHMAKCKELQAGICADMKAHYRIARQRHDEAALEVGKIDRRLEKTPDAIGLLNLRDQYNNVREGLYSCCEHANGLHEQVTGVPIVKPPHRAKGFGGKFAKKDSLEHALVSLES